MASGVPSSSPFPAYRLPMLAEESSTRLACAGGTGSLIHQRQVSAGTAESVRESTPASHCPRDQWKLLSQLSSSPLGRYLQAVRCDPAETTQYPAPPET